MPPILYKGRRVEPVDGDPETFCFRDAEEPFEISREAVLVNFCVENRCDANDAPAILLRPSAETRGASSRPKRTRAAPSRYGRKEKGKDDEGGPGSATKGDRGDDGAAPSEGAVVPRQAAARSSRKGKEKKTDMAEEDSDEIRAKRRNLGSAESERRDKAEAVAELQRMQLAAIYQQAKEQGQREKVDATEQTKEDESMELLLRHKQDHDVRDGHEAATGKRNHMSENVREAIAKAWQKGFSNAQLARVYNVNPSTLSRMKKRWLTTGTTKRKAGCGRKRLVADSVMAILARFLLLDPRRKLDMARVLAKREFDITFCASTISKTLKNGYGFALNDFRVVPTDCNTDSAIDARANYCSEAVTIQDELSWGIYVGEMPLQLNTRKRVGWTAIGYHPVFPDKEGGSMPNTVVTVYAAIIPKVGMLCHMVHHGKRGTDVFIDFLNKVVEANEKENIAAMIENGDGNFVQRIIFVDGQEHAVHNWFQSHTAKRLKLKHHAMPRHSPFLTPVQDFFGSWVTEYTRLLMNDAGLAAQHATLEEYLATALAALAERRGLGALTMALFERTVGFWPQCSRKEPVVAEQILDGMHAADRVALGNERFMTKGEMEQILRKYHPSELDHAQIMPPDPRDAPEDALAMQARAPGSQMIGPGSRGE